MTASPPPLTDQPGALASGRPPLREQVAGEDFVRGLPTPFLTTTIANVEAALRAAVTRAGLAATVVPYRPLRVGTRHRVVPALSLFDPHGQRVLVVEIRTESTERFDLGLKRLVYQEAAIDDYWFLDPASRRLLVMRRDGDGDYAWPPTEPTTDDDVAPARLLEVTVPVEALMPGSRAARRPRWS